MDNTKVNVASVHSKMFKPCCSNDLSLTIHVDEFKFFRFRDLTDTTDRKAVPFCQFTDGCIMIGAGCKA